MDGRPSAVFGWSWIALGLVLGLVLGIFALGGPVSPPPALADYAGLPRRLLRLSHIACVALGALNVLAAREPATGRCGALRAGRLLLAAGSALLPPALALAAFFPGALYLAPLPALLAASGTAAVAWSRLPPPARAARWRPIRRALARAGLASGPESRGYVLEARR